MKKGFLFGFGILLSGIVLAAAVSVSGIPEKQEGEFLMASEFNKIIGTLEGVYNDGGNVHISPSAYTTSFGGPNIPSALSIGGGIPSGSMARLTFGNGAQGNYAGIGAQVTGGGSYLFFGTSSNYSQGINNVALEITPSGDVIARKAKSLVSRARMNFPKTSNGKTCVAPAASDHAAYERCRAVFDELCVGQGFRGGVSIDWDANGMDGFCFMKASATPVLNL